MFNIGCVLGVGGEEARQWMSEAYTNNAVGVIICQRMVCISGNIRRFQNLKTYVLEGLLKQYAASKPLEFSAKLNQ